VKGVTKVEAYLPDEVVSRNKSMTRKLLRKIAKGSFADVQVKPDL
jgi:hypothetical protein